MTHPIRTPLRATEDRLPALVAGWVERGLHGPALLSEVLRQVERVSAPYPDAWFTLGRKEEHAVRDLAHRVFTVCARVVKGRHPFLGRVPFLAYQQERFEGRAIRYHSFYARLSITRELMHQDYALNIVRDPRLRWEAELHRQVGEELKKIATPEGNGRGRRWRLTSPPSLRSLTTLERLPELLRATRPRDVPTLVREALTRVEPLTHVQITRALTQILERPAVEGCEGEEETMDPMERAMIRDAIGRAWAELSDDERALLLLVVRGASFHEVTARQPRFKDPATLTNTIRRCNDTLLRYVMDSDGAGARSTLPPRAMLDRIFDVIASSLPVLLLDEERSP